MKQVIAAYTGTFDPITEGHANLIRRAALMFDHIVVAVADSPSKNPMFDLAERIRMAEATLSDISNIEVCGYGGMTVEFARSRDVTVMVRGLRSVADFEYEVQMDAMNKYLAAEVDTIYLSPPEHLRHVSSSLVRQVAMFGGDVSPFVHPSVAAALTEKSTATASEQQPEPQPEQG